MHFYVKDSGIGVPKDRRKAIFNRFEQADIRDRRAFQGSGLGLAIVKAYVEMLNGEVGIDSEKGKRFFYLDKNTGEERKSNRAKHTEKKKKTPKPAILDLENLKILIAEDDSIQSKNI